MLGNIVKIENNRLYINLKVDSQKLISVLNMYIVMEDSESSFIGEIVNIDGNTIIVSLLGEIKDDTLIYGYVKKPAINAKINLLSPLYVQKLIGDNGDEKNSLLIGSSPFYKDVTINANINKLFASHMAIMGLTGSGKSCGFARIIQNLMEKEGLSTRTNLIIFDAYGEYHSAFCNNDKAKYNFKAYSTNKKDGNLLNIPIWLLDVDDFALLLEITKKNQLTVIEKALRYVDLFKKPEEDVIKYKNSIIASAILDILLSGKQAAQIRDQILSALSKFNTATLNLESIIEQPGYKRTFRQCLHIDENGKINAIELVTEFLQNMILPETKTTLPDGTYAYTLEDLENALEFTLISEGIWKSDKVFDDANVLKVRLHALINSDNKDYFSYPSYVTLNDYISRLVTTADHKKAQIINFNINNLDDRLSKIIVKIYSKLFYNYAKNLPIRGSIPFNIFLEEAHRYVQDDLDRELLGYNIFDRIAKEGRKYGVLLGLITQRPNEISETALSQCNNFLIFKTTHPNDVNYISQVVPNITEEVIERMKTISSGHCIAFGTAFKLPVLIKLDMPDPAPNSNNVNISNIWFD